MNTALLVLKCYSVLVVNGQAQKEVDLERFRVSASKYAFRTSAGPATVEVQSNITLTNTNGLSYSVQLTTAIPKFNVSESAFVSTDGQHASIVGHILGGGERLLICGFQR